MCVCCEGDGNTGVGSGGGVIAVRAYMGGSGVLSSAGDMLEMGVVRGVCRVCVCVLLGAGWGEWVTGLGLGFTNSGGTWGKWDMCFGCGGVGGVGGEWLGGLVECLAGWVVLCVCCESGFSVLMAGSGICMLYLAGSCTS